MNQESDPAAFLAGDLVSESNVRKAPEPPTRTAEGPDADYQASAEISAVAENNSSAEGPAGAAPPPSRVQLVRRWWVAELLAGAVSRPAPSGLAH